MIKGICRLFLHLPDILIILNIPVKRLVPQHNSIVRSLLKLRLCHLLFEIPGVVSLVALVVHVPDRVGL